MITITQRGHAVKQGIRERHVSDRQGRPAGGQTNGVGIEIWWQDGPLGNGPDRVKPNGAFVEDVIDAALGRLEFYQRSEFECRENELAIEGLKVALEALDSRTRRRKSEGVEGTHEL